MTLVWGFAAFVLAIVWILTIVDIFGRQNTTGAKIGWIVAVLIVPYLGAIVYWIVRKPDAGSAEQAYQLEAERRARAGGH